MKRYLVFGSTLALIGWCVTAHAADVAVPAPATTTASTSTSTSEDSAVTIGQNEVAQTTVAQAYTVQDEELGTARTEATQEDITKGYLGKEKVGIKPQVGALFLTDAAGQGTERGMAGLSLEANLNPQPENGLYIGPSTGFFYSHIGSSGGGFFGTDTGAGSQPSSNIGLIPVDLKVGMQFGDGNARISAHGGGNVIYRSVTASTILSTDDGTRTGSDWTIYPNVGVDLEYGPLLIRPDWTITPGSDIWALTAGLIVPIG